MAKEFSRTQRVSDQIQKDLAGIIQREVKDPRVGMVTINTVTISKDLSYAEVYITNMTFGKNEETEESRKECVKVLNNASSFLRTMLGKGLKLRIVPELRFHFDVVIDRGSHLTNLINKAVEQDKKHEDYGKSDAQDQSDDT